MGAADRRYVEREDNVECLIVQPRIDSGFNGDDTDCIDGARHPTWWLDLVCGSRSLFASFRGVGISSCYFTRPAFQSFTLSPSFSFTSLSFSRPI